MAEKKEPPKQLSKKEQEAFRKRLDRNRAVTAKYFSSLTKGREYQDKATAEFRTARELRRKYPFLNQLEGEVRKDSMKVLLEGGKEENPQEEEEEDPMKTIPKKKRRRRMPLSRSGGGEKPPDPEGGNPPPPPPPPTPQVVV